jgi:hypothetical protein
MIGKVGLGWRPDMPDFRDEEYSFKAKLSASAPAVETLPVRAMALWDKAGKKNDRPATDYPVFDQLETNSCTGNAAATMMGLVSGLALRSRLHLYYEARRMIGETDRDEGAYLRDVAKALATLGAGRETWWKFDPKNICVDPPVRLDEDAADHVPVSYHRLEGRDEFRQCLAHGFPFIIGISCYDRLFTQQTADTGILPYPRTTEKMQGGHAVCIIGYDSEFQNSDWAKEAMAKGFPYAEIPNDVYIVRNSWSADWGYHGSFAIAARYLENTKSRR